MDRETLTTFDEQCRRFVGIGRGYGRGSGSGSGRGRGMGSGRGDANGILRGDGRGWGDGIGDGMGCGMGCGGLLSRLKAFGTRAVYSVDGLPTILVRIRGDFAKGCVLRDDMTLEPCWIAKGGNHFAHGETLRAARDALLEKLFADMPEDERIRAFVAAHEGGRAYPNSDFFTWHHKLTGSCEMGRRQFAAAHDIDIDHGAMTVREFIALTRCAYGGSIIQKLEAHYDF